MVRSSLTLRLHRWASLATLVVAPLLSAAYPAAAVAGALPAYHVTLETRPQAKIGSPASPDPSANTPASPDPSPSCSAGTLDESTACLTAELAAINNARAAEGVGPMVFDLVAFQSLSVPEQLFAVANLERTARGLTPFRGLTAALDADAQRGASAGTDPTVDLAAMTNSPLAIGGSNWAGGFVDPLDTDYSWMYDDGYGGPNIDCPTSGATGCWGHRDNILAHPAICPNGTAVDLMGAAFASTSATSYAEVFVSSCDPSPANLVFTWPAAKRLLGIAAAPPAAKPAGDAASALQTLATHENANLISSHLKVVASLGSARRGHVISLDVTLASGRADRTVVVEVQTGRTWTARARRRTSARGRAHLRVQVTAHIAPRICVVVPQRGAFAGAASCMPPTVVS